MHCRCKGSWFHEFVRPGGERHLGGASAQIGILFASVYQWPLTFLYIFNCWNSPVLCMYCFFDELKNVSILSMLFNSKHKIPNCIMNFTHSIFNHCINYKTLFIFVTSHKYEECCGTDIHIAPIQSHNFSPTFEFFGTICIALFA